MKHRLIKNGIILFGGIMLLSACWEKQFGKATPEAAAQYEEVLAGYKAVKSDEELEEVLAGEDEITELITRFDQTADVHYTTPERGITMLHLACLFKKPELARCLLLEGANPNARTRDAYGEVAWSPLGYALTPGIDDSDTADTIIQLVDLLVQSGADTKGVIYYDRGLLETAAYACEHEAVARHLLQYAGPVTAEDIALVMERGWAYVLEDILKTKPTLTAEDAACIVCAGYIIKDHYDGLTNMRMVELFLNKGADINATYKGSTILQEAAAHLSYAEDEEFLNKWLDFIAYLISKGADVAQIAGAESAHAGLCAYDILANRPGVLEALEKRGLRLVAPPMEIRGGIALIDDLTRAGIRKMGADAARPYLQQIASVFSPTQEQMAHDSFSMALLSAAEILYCVDPAYAAEVINASPLWQIPPNNPHHDHSTCQHATAATLIYILVDVPGVCVDRNKILQVIRQAELINDRDLAAHAVELLGRDPQATEIVEELCKSPNLAIQAGAWSAKLQHMGLPPCTNGAVKRWLATHGREADTPAIRTALLATSLDEMWYGNLSAERKAECIQALRTIGAPESAITVYGEYADNMDNPEKLDELEALGKDWSYELEIATARYILQHADDFLNLIQQSNVDK